MSNDIEDFLRKAAQRRAAKGSVPPPASKVVRRPLRQLRPIDDAIVEIVDAQSLEAGADVAQHVAKHLDSREFGERAAHLGEAADSAHVAMQTHLHQTFDHKIGRLSGDTVAMTSGDAILSGAGTRVALTIGQEIFALLRNRDTLRTAIVLNEILDRPQHRW